MTIYRPLVRSASTNSLRNGSYARPEEMVRVLVGQEHREFHVNRRLLSACSTFFTEKLAMATTPRTPISLTGESPAMFELFVAWLHDQSCFRRHLEQTINGVISPGASAATAFPFGGFPKGVPTPATTNGIQAIGDQCTLSQRLHWALVRLHLFAANIGLPSVQDMAMDALQDLYLRRDWDVTPRLVRFLYAQCHLHQSLRIRRWAVAMVAYSLASSAEEQPQRNVFDATSGRSARSVPAQFHDLFRSYPEFEADYEGHIRKMTTSGLDIRGKNPQLRVPTNRLRTEDRRFAFRQCAFHTHRASVGEGRCPHLEEERRNRRAAMVGEGALSEQVRGQLAVQRPGMVISVMDLVVDTSYGGYPLPPVPFEEDSSSSCYSSENESSSPPTSPEEGILPFTMPFPKMSSATSKLPPRPKTAGASKAQSARLGHQRSATAATSSTIPSYQELQKQPMVSVFDDVPKPLRRLKSMKNVAARAKGFLQGHGSSAHEPRFVMM